MPKSRKRAGQYLQHRLLGGDIDVGNDVGPALEGDLLVGVPAVLDDPTGGPGGLYYHVHRRTAGGGYGQRIFWSFCHIVLVCTVVIRAAPLYAAGCRDAPRPAWKDRVI